VGGQRVLRELSSKYWWPKMAKLINRVCAACRQCQLAQIRRKHLHATFEGKPKLLPRQAYGIDFYGHAKGYILVAIDLCTREVILWFVKNRTQETVARCLLTGLIFQKGVPMTFRSDSASEFVHGVVNSLNKYLGIEHIATGGYNARANATVERFMQTLNAMLRKFNKQEYANISGNLQAIAFAHNTTYSSVLECTPFECGHGLRARTICDARMSPRLQFNPEEGSEGDDSIAKWDTTVSQKVLELATRLAQVAQTNVEWHRRMTSDSLNQAGRPIPKEIPEGSLVFFYKPPTQTQVEKEGRMAKHLAHYCGPAKVMGLAPGRKRTYLLEYQGKDAKKATTYHRDVGMIVPANQMPKTEDLKDPADVPEPEPVLHDPNTTLPLKEGELVITKDSPDSTDWYVAEVYKVLPDYVQVKYFSTRTPALEDLTDKRSEQRIQRLKQVHFRRTWFFRSGKNAGKGSVNPPYPNNEDLRVWEGPLPNNELSDVLLVRRVGLTAAGKLTNESLKLVAQLELPHAVTPTVEDEEVPKDPSTFYTLDTNHVFDVTTVRFCGCATCSS
jgi:transposase InsO family protein